MREYRKRIKVKEACTAVQSFINQKDVIEKIGVQLPNQIIQNYMNGHSRKEGYSIT